MNEDTKALLAHQRLAAGQETGNEHHNHITTPFDLPGRKEVADAISRATKEAVARVPFVDRRNASSLRCEFENFKGRLHGQEADRVKAEQAIVKFTGRLVDLRKLLKKYQELAAKSPQYSQRVDETASKITTVESELAFHKKDLERVSRIIDSIKKLMKQFLADTPGKGYPTTAEMLRDQDELRKLEAEAADLVRF